MVVAEERVVVVTTTKREVTAADDDKRNIYIYFVYESDMLTTLPIAVLSIC